MNAYGFVQGGREGGFEAYAYTVAYAIYLYSKSRMKLRMP